MKYSLSDVTLTSSANSIVETTAGSNTVSFQSTRRAVVKVEVGGQVVTLTFHVTDTTAPDPVKIDYTAGAKRTITVEEGSVYETSLKDYVTVGDKADLKDVKWDVKDSTVATVTNGIVKGISKGTTVVTATTVDGYYVTFDVTVQDVMELSAYKTEFDIDLREQKAVDLDAYLKLTNADADVTLASVVCTSSSTDIATVADHKVSFAKTGTVYVKAALNDQVVTFTFHVVDTTAPKPIKVTHKTCLLYTSPSPRD